MQPQGKVLQAYSDSRAPISIIRGPLGSGKTVQTILKVFELMCEQEPVSLNNHPNFNVRLSRWVAVRNTYQELFSTTIKDWLEIHGDIGEFKQGSKEPPNHKMRFHLDDGTEVKAEIYFIAFDRPEHVKKARGLQLTGAWLNETKELSKSVVDMLDLRVGRYPSAKEGCTATWYGMVGDTNSPDEDHWYFDLAELEKPEGWDFFTQPGGVIKDKQGNWIENPLAENVKNLPPNYYTRGLQGKSEDWIKVNLANEYGFVSSGKPVHPHYVDSVHCKDLDFQPLLQYPIILGFDFGRTPACAFIQETPSGGWVCFDEFCADDMSAVSFAPNLKSYIDKNYPGHRFEGYGDPSGNSRGQGTDDTPFKIIRAEGIPCFPAPTNEPLLRRSAVENPLKELTITGEPRLIVTPKAKMIRKGLAGGFCYRRIQVSGEKFTEEPDKNEYSHAVEGLEYGLAGKGEGTAKIRHNIEKKTVNIPTITARNLSR